MLPPHRPFREKPVRKPATKAKWKPRMVPMALSDDDGAMLEATILSGKLGLHPHRVIQPQEPLILKPKGD